MISHVRVIPPVAILLLVWTLTPAAHSQSTRTHTVQAGETLYRIAGNYDSSVEELRRANDLSGNTIAVGQRLIIPGSARPTQQVQDGYHEVEPGETLYSIAARYELTVDTLLAVNQDLDLATSLEEGQQLVLPEQFQTTRYTVRSGNTLGSIAREHDVSVNAVRRANNIQGDKIRVGQVLTIPSRAVPEPQARGSLGSVDTTGVAQMYPNTFAGRLTASGEPYNPEAFTASHPSLPFDSVLLLTHPETERSTFVRINDRGPVDPGVLIEISRAAAQVVGITDVSSPSLEVRRVK